MQPRAPTPRDRIVLATSNPHKVEEMRALFAAGGFALVGLDEAARSAGVTLTEPAEVGQTFEENARIKAESYARQLGMVCLADDSGLEIDALGGRPGVISSHYCTDGREVGMSRAERDAANNARVLGELEGVAAERRGARFVCVMCVAGPRDTKRPDEAETMHACDAPRGAGGADVPSARAGLVVTTSDRSPLFAPVLGFTAHHRRLPHWQSPGAVYFITFRVSSGELSPAERDIVADACLHWHGSRMHVAAVVVMPDHVHLLCKPLERPGGCWPVPELVKSIKRFAAGEINQLRGTTGAVWQDEYYDRIVRDGHEFDEKYGYIVENPVRKRLVPRAMDYRWLRDPEREKLVRAMEARHAGWGAAERADGTSAPPARRGMADGEPAPHEPIDTTPTERADGTGGSAPPARGRMADGEPAPPARGGPIMVRGTFEGRIGEPPRVPAGSNGFGYDPLFLVGPDHIRTGAELPTEEKNRLSHRAAAARLMLPRLREMFSTGGGSP